jgi:hypothetical protein
MHFLRLSLVVLLRLLVVVLLLRWRSFMLLLCRRLVVLLLLWSIVVLLLLWSIVVLLLLWSIVVLLLGRLCDVVMLLRSCCLLVLNRLLLQVLHLNINMLRGLLLRLSRVVSVKLLQLPPLFGTLVMKFRRHVFSPHQKGAEDQYMPQHTEPSKTPPIFLPLPFFPLLLNENYVARRQIFHFLLLIRITLCLVCQGEHQHCKQ